jgi:hypothetical protein
MPYIVCVLTVLLLAIVPCALWADMSHPITAWEYWYLKGQPHPMPRFRLPDQIPRLLRAEEWLFRILVTPPAFAAKLVGMWPGNYGLTFVSPGSSSEAAASLPPAALALEHLERAVPFWLAITVLLYEGGSLVGRQARRVRVAEHGAAPDAGGCAAVGGELSDVRQLENL